MLDISNRVLLIGHSKGNVIRKNMCILLAPSISAASYNSEGIP